ncbi:MAG: aspartyl/glutamyl-tRNA amidotransferase subunit A, partial [Chloroflexi bacterium]|nr:aspartyl/glutamyl-tRNA amidotransferase subunit A [Chloroflexota bacterium]
SRFGLVAFASSLDQIGPLTKDVTDCALVMNAIAGYDPQDSTSLNFAVPDYTQALAPELKGVRVGVPREYFAQGIEPEVEKLVRAAIDRLKDLGAEIGEVSLPHTGYGLASYYIIAPAECSANLARYDGVKYGYSAPDAGSMWDGYFKTRQRGFGPEVKRRIMLGTYALSSGYYDAYYLKAQKVRTLIKRDFDEAFEKFDVLVAPTSPSVAFKVGERTDNPLAMYASDVCTIPVNLAGLPGISVPCGFSQDLPVGLQLIGSANRSSSNSLSLWERGGVRVSDSTRRSHTTKVECHAGRHYPDRPLAFQWQGRRLEVEEVEQQWRSQEAAYGSSILHHYRVRTAEGRFHLTYDSKNDDWQVARD